MSSQVSVAIVNVAFLLVQLAAGAGGVVPIVKWLKDSFSLGLASSRIVTFAVTLGLSVLALVVEGVISYESVVSDDPTITALNVVIAILTALTGSQIEYLRKKRVDPTY